MGDIFRHFQCCTHALRRERRLAQAHAGGVENGVGDRRRAWHRSRFADAQHGLARTRHVQHVDDRHFAEIQDGVTAPFAVRHGVLARLELQLLLQCAAGGLQHVAVQLLLDAGRVHQQTGVLPDDDAPHMDFAAVAVDLHIRHPGGPGRAKTRPLAVHVTGVGKTLAAQQRTVAGLLLGLGMRFPAGARGRGTHQVDGAGIVQMPQAVVDRIDAGSAGQFVDKAFVGKGVR